MKKFVNDPQQFVPEMLKGIAARESGLAALRPRVQPDHAGRHAARRQGLDHPGVGLGHEPAHVMAVGRGMLDAACPGDVFAAPPSDYVYETSKLLNSEKGVLHIINNYTGDKMAFDMGRELAEAEDVEVGTVVVDDDVAVKDSTYTSGAAEWPAISSSSRRSGPRRSGRRPRRARRSRRAGQLGHAFDGNGLTSCTPPAKGSPLFDLGGDEIEMGVGIHGEPGGAGRSSSPPTKSSMRCSKRWSPTCPTSRATRWR